MNKIKRMFAGVLAFVMVVIGIVVTPTQADAAVAEDMVIYEEYSAEDTAKYWKVDGKVAPIKEGYVFGGWFANVDAKGTTTEVSEDGKYYDPLTTVSGAAYAKFVPAQVLSIKAQNTETTKADSTITDVRVMTSLDSKNYEKIGFDIWLSNKNKLYKDDNAKTQLETENIYKGVLRGGKPVDAVDIFGGVSRYVSVWQLGKVAQKYFGNIIYVRPYWITIDGTKVEGLAKYVHVEDEYLGYTSIPVNLLGGENVAAGVWSLKADKALVLAGDSETIAFEAGRVLPDMAFKFESDSQTVKMAGNAKEVNKYSEELTGENETLLANIRFKSSGVTAGTVFTVTPETFADWNEELVTPRIWDVKYVK